MTRPILTDLPGSFQAVDRVLAALFGRHAANPRHEHNRLAHRGANLSISFRTFLARLYGGAWLAGGTVTAVGAVVSQAVPAAVAAGIVFRLLVVWAGCRYLHLRALTRKRALERTLPGAVRHLRILSTGEIDGREMLSEVAAHPALYGETAVTFRRVLNRTQLAGGLSRGLRDVATETPSDVFSSFLLRLQAVVGTGKGALTDHLELEARMLEDQKRRGQARRSSYAELVGEVVGLVIVLPAAVAVLVTTAGLVLPGLYEPAVMPVGELSPAAVLLYGCAIGVLIVGIAAAVLLQTLRRHPSRSAWTVPSGIGQLVETGLRNPASTAVILAPLAGGISWGLFRVGLEAPTAGLYGYALFAIPTGLVGLRYEQRALVMDRELREFVHGLAAVTGRGRTFSEAVEEVSTEYSLDRLSPAVSTLAFNLRVGTQSDTDVREAALSNFAANVGTPLARRLAAILSGAFTAGCQTPELFELLEEDLDHVYHRSRTAKRTMRGLVLVVWATALVTAAILAVIGVYVLDGIAQLAAVPNVAATVPGVGPTAAGGVSSYQLYILAAATAVSCGWVAGALNGSRGGIFLHSGVLGLVVFMGFRLLGLA